MTEINRALGSAASPYPLLVGDTTYQLTPLTKGVQGAFEAWLKARARADIHAMKSELSQEDYIAALAKVARDGVAGIYLFTGEVAAQAMQTLDGLVHLLWLMLQKHQPKLTEEDVFTLAVEHQEECAAALNDMTADLKKKAATRTTEAAKP